MANNCTNINKMNSYMSPENIEYKKDYDKCRWNSMSWFGIHKMFWGYSR